MLSFLKKLFGIQQTIEPHVMITKPQPYLLSEQRRDHKKRFLQTLTQVLEEHGADPSQVPSLGTIDRIDWHEEVVWEIQASDDLENIDDETYELFQKYAGNHIGLFLAWLAHRDLLGNDDPDYSQDGIKQLKARQITGTDYLIDYCDTKFWSVDVADSLLPIIEEFYTAYLILYADFLPANEAFYTRLFSWSDYDQLAPKIDQLYAKYTS